MGLRERGIPLHHQRRLTAAQAAQGAIEVAAGRHQRPDHHRVARDAAQHQPQIDIPVRLHGVDGQRRQRAARRIADDTQRGERQAGIGRVSRSDMALHIDRRSAGFVAQGSLGRPRRNHLLDTDKARTHDAPPAEPVIVDEFFAERSAGDPVLLTGRDVGGDHDVARFQFGVEATGHAEADHAAHRAGIETGQQRTKLRRTAAAANDGHAGAGGNARLLHQTSHDQDGPRVEFTRGRKSVPCPQDHIPTPTSLLFVE